jgi:nicotinate-nucleotide adenylyltransferase
VKVGVLGGTFDPIHIGHLLLAEAAREELGLEKVLFVPAGHQWRKEQVDRDIAPAEHRLVMVKLAIAGNEAFEASAMEIERDGPSYTVETLEALRAEMPGAQFWFIVGVDALADMPHWHRVERIFELASVCVAGRPGEDESSGMFEDRVTPLAMAEVGISSTDIRERARAGKSVRYMVPDAVGRYIEEQGLYAG